MIFTHLFFCLDTLKIVQIVTFLTAPYNKLARQELRM
jgi:hypothetical protein